MRVGLGTFLGSLGLGEPLYGTKISDKRTSPRTENHSSLGAVLNQAPVIIIIGKVWPLICWEVM